MKVYNEASNIKLTDKLNAVLEDVRAKADFCSKSYIDQKAQYLNSYMEKCRLDACVIAISGGIDSAIVLALVNHASRMGKSPIRKIVPVMLPALGSSGVTGQYAAKSRGEQLCEGIGLKGFSININPAVGKIMDSVETELGLETDRWAIGQLCPYTRTPILYYITSLLNVASYGGIVVGTTNRDEGAYLGYIGKASDGMVDVQLISDLHKSEVYKVAKQLEIPQSIIDVIPTGDMYDRRTDTEVFGAPYDFVELYLHYLNADEYERADFYNKLDLKSRRQFNGFALNIESLHRYNRHKYIGKSPAVHLDLWDCSCPDGWDNYYEITKQFMTEI